MDRTNETINLIIRLEGVKLQAYLDNDTPPNPTIGVGCTRYPGGKAVKMGDVCSIVEAKSWLQCHLNLNVFPLLRDYNVPDTVHVALSSFIYNVGHLGPSIIKAIHDKNWNELADAFRLYTHDSEGKVDEGLVNRREIEIKYFLC
jgi:lysozyme